MMKKGELLMIVHRVPFPPDKGDKIRSFNELKFLYKRGWRVHLCTLADDPADLIHLDDLKKYCASLYIEPLNKKFQKIRSLLAPFRGLPMSANYFYLPRLQQRVNEIIDRHPIDAILCFCSPMAEYLRRGYYGSLLRKGNAPVTCVMDLVDVDSYKWEQYADCHSVPMKWIYRLEGRLLSRYERKVAESFAATVLVSSAEADMFRNRTALRDKVHVVANGVDLDFFHPDPIESERYGRRFTFCGAMGYLPNADAVSWFALEVLPLIRQEEKNAEFWIVGGGAGNDVTALSDLPGVRLTGRVDDVRPFVRDSAISVAPIRIARGIQNKVLEAMAMGKPVLSTPQAFEGLEVEAGRDLMVVPAEREAFAAAAVALFRDPARRRKMGRQARGVMEEKYSWSVRLQALEELLTSS